MTKSELIGRLAARYPQLVAKDAEDRAGPRPQQLHDGIGILAVMALDVIVDMTDFLILSVLHHLASVHLFIYHLPLLHLLFSFLHRVLSEQVVYRTIFSPT